MVNLDGTLSYQAPDGAGAGRAALSQNLLQVKAIRAAVSVPIQFAGGLRSAPISRPRPSSRWSVS